MKKTFFLLLIVLALYSCNNNKDFTTFENNQWYASKPQSFEITIDNDSKPHDISLEFSYVFGTTFPEFPIQIAITSPSGKTENHTVAFPIATSEKNTTTDCTGDVCDLSTTFLANQKLEKGVYKVVISQNYRGEYVPNVIGAGIHFKEVK